MGGCTGIQMLGGSDVPGLRANPECEIDSAALYWAMAAHEPDAKFAERIVVPYYRYSNNRFYLFTCAA